MVLRWIPFPEIQHEEQKSPARYSSRDRCDHSRIHAFFLLLGLHVSSTPRPVLPRCQTDTFDSYPDLVPEAGQRMTVPRPSAIADTTSDETVAFNRTSQFRPKRGWLSAIECRIAQFATRRPVAVLTIFLLALGARLAVLPIEPIPAPGVHDEFSYLLMADTFAHGRLTNPTHPMWIHFESEAINQQPTYCSAFYPAQGAFLAAGQVIFRHPFWGVWLSTGLMCAAICWALQGWMPPAWAFLAGILAIFRFGVFNYWADSYWGGSVAALGGALVLGALPRIKRQQRIRDAILMGVGFALLANSRPYEGLVYSLPILVALAVFVFGKKVPPLRLSARRIVLPLAIVMTLTFVFMAYYFWRTTGNPIRPPYLVNVATYMQEPQFVWGSIKSPVEYHNSAMANFYRTYHLQDSVQSKQFPLRTVFTRAFEWWAFYVGPALTVPLFLLAGILPYGLSFNDLGKTRFLLILALVTFIGLLLPVHNLPHYAAPMTCVTLALILQAIRQLRVWGRHGFKKGLWAVRVVVALCVCSFFLVTLRMSFGVSREKALSVGMRGNIVLRFDVDVTNPTRLRIVHSLTKQGRHYLIIVRYRPDHDGHQEWVYNDADIDNSKIVWAREMTPVEDEQLINYFKDRQVLLLDADAHPPKLSPYSLPKRQDQVEASTEGTAN